MKAPTRWELFVDWLDGRRFAFFEWLLIELHNRTPTDWQFSEWWDWLHTRLERLAGHGCQEDGCREIGIPCYVGWDSANDGEWSDTQPTAYFCPKHAPRHGFCGWCGQFSAGIESFDMNPRGLCDNCGGHDDDDWHPERGDDPDDDGFYNGEDLEEAAEDDHYYG